MSAAATAAGYLYASGRLRGRASRESEAERPQQEKPALRQKVRVAVYTPEQAPEQTPEQAPPPRRAPKIEYRVRRRWSVA